MSATTCGAARVQGAQDRLERALGDGVAPGDVPVVVHQEKPSSSTSMSVVPSVVPHMAGPRDHARERQQRILDQHGTDRTSTDAHAEDGTDVNDAPVDEDEDAGMGIGNVDVTKLSDLNPSLFS